MRLRNCIPIALAMMATMTINAQVRNLPANTMLVKFLRDTLEHRALIFDSLRSCTVDSRKMFVCTAYTQKEDHDDYLLSWLFEPVGTSRYREIFIDSQGMNGGLAEIAAVFSANSDRDAEPEIIVLYRWPVKNHDFEGHLFQVRCYDGIRDPERSLRLLQRQPMDHFEFEGYREGRTEHASYNTEAKIRRRLKQLGY